MTESTHRYRGFISYSQKDQRFAKKLHRALEAFTLPGGKKLGRFFRDDDELGGAASLGAALAGAIRDSEDLIVIASTNSAASKWVNEEVIHFKKLADPEKQVFAVVLDGTPNAAEASDECFVPALRSRVNAAGELTGEPDEPLAPDVRKDTFRRLVTKLAAGLEGIPFDELWQREKRRARRRVLTGVAVIAAIAAPLAWWGTATNFQLEARESQLQSLDTATQEQNFKDHYFAQIQDRQWALQTPEAYMVTRDAFDAALTILLASDLDGDGYQDYFTSLEVLDFCGAAGCLHEVLLHENGTYAPVHRSNGGDLQVLTTSQNGVRDLALGLGGLEDGTSFYTLLRYDGAQYQTAGYVLCDGSVTYCGLSTVFTETPRGETLFGVFDLLSSAEAERLVTELNGRPVADRITAGRLPDVATAEPGFDEVIGVDREGGLALVRIWKSNYGLVSLSTD